MNANPLRQACDLCYRRKIKCDGSKPRCSQCKVYDCDCTFVAPRRKRPKRKPPGGTQASERGLKRSGTSEQDASSIEKPRAQITSAEDLTDRMRRHLELPPSKDLYPLIELFLCTVNSVLPLYNDASLLETARIWYEEPSRRTAANWTTLNVVMALAQCFGQDPATQSGAFIEDCVGKAQTMLTDLIMGDVQLETLQILLGLVLLFQRMPNVRPASVLIATTFRLIHEMGLHRREGYEGICDTEVLQRRRVFWVAYILDRDISMRSRQPSIHQDADTDVDFPSDDPVIDEAGFVASRGGSVHFGFFRARVQLAQIQGQVHDCLFSTQAQYRPQEDTIRESLRLRLVLVDWRAQIPAGLDAAALIQNHSVVLAKLFCILYATHLSLLCQLTRVNAMEFSWVHMLLRHVRAVNSGLPSVPPVWPESWDGMVVESRAFITLFLNIAHKDVGFGRMYCCSLISGLIFLSANLVASIGYEHHDSDQRLLLQAKLYLEELVQHTHPDALTEAQKAYAELDWQVGRLLQRQLETAPSGVGI